jgi:hypothetical protein
MRSTAAVRQRPSPLAIAYFLASLGFASLGAVLLMMANRAGGLL